MQIDSFHVIIFAALEHLHGKCMLPYYNKSIGKLSVQSWAKIIST